jgi:hypothetical protein
MRKKLFEKFIMPLWVYVAFFTVVTVFVLFIAMVATGCKTAQKNSSREHHTAVVVKTEDSSGSSKQTAVDSKQSERVVRVEKDSVGVVPGGEAEIYLLPEEVEPVTDVTGATTGRTFTKRDGTMLATVTVDAKGGIKVKCKEDSLRLVLFRYRMDSISLVKRLDSLYGEVMITEHSEIKDSVSTSVNAESEVVVKGQGFCAGVKRFFWHIVFFVLGAIVGYFIKMFV